MRIRTWLVLPAALAFGVGLWAQGNRPAAIAAGDWVNINREPGATRFSPLTQINPGNVAKLTQAWTLPMGTRAKRCGRTRSKRLPQRPVARQRPLQLGPPRRLSALIRFLPSLRVERVAPAEGPAAGPAVAAAADAAAARRHRSAV